ncbi:hypothetical protein FRB97_009756 [Tulasnella sp. 331]|nr:hypothetical protein FRB97_009756 [Tulasnella sp. 331]KAG8872495.1 hypothetical protein FRB98_009571 [Tulasnella sp. 332]
MQPLTLACDSLKTLHLTIEQSSAESATTTLKGLDDRGLEPKVVGLSQYYSTKEIVTKVESGGNWGLGAGGWGLGEGSIANLSSSGFNTPLTKVNQILNSDPFSSLSRFSVTVPSSGAIDRGVYAFFVFVSSYCKGLHTLHLNLYQYPPDPNPITSSGFQPLFHLKSLEVLEPSLRRLSLASEPTNPVEENSRTSLSILHAFAQHLDPVSPSLESIGQYFKAESSRLSIHEVFDAFHALRELDVGTPPIDSNDLFSVVTFLGGLCNPALTIRAGRRSGQMNSNEGQVVAVWGQAGASLRVLHTFQSPLRYKLEAPESEVRKARAEVAAWKMASNETWLRLESTTESEPDPEGSKYEGMGVKTI